MKSGVTPLSPVAQPSLDEVETYPEDHLFAWPDAQHHAVHHKSRCGRCHGLLSLYPAPDRLWLVMCDQCGVGVGFCSKQYAEARAQDAQAATLAALTSIRQAGMEAVFGLPAPQPQTEAELLAALGF